jgi:DNA-directed RNA polymerase specialized sigma24 family protein
VTNEQYEVIERKLHMLVRLAALSFVGDKPQQDKIMMLSSAGFQPKEIADICGTTPNTVRVALSTIRKKRGKRKGIPKAPKNTINDSVQ